ncbi:MAG: hypothetical protein VKJ04_01575 [Vampirovibrionales bacterium]|nr:hypothetical protein [Vampirovibrionales bacterium]
MPPFFSDFPHSDFSISVMQEQEIIASCNRFKKSVQRHAAGKKDLMKTCFAYIKNKFVGNDLLPIPSSLGNERDNNRARPQVFIPLARQQLKSIYAQLKLTIFPNDQDYFRIRAKNSQGVMYEDSLTEGLKYLFKEARISEKLGACIYNLIWSGCFVAMPMLKQPNRHAWEYRPESSCDNQAAEFSPAELLPAQFLSAQLQAEPSPDVESLNPLNFYIDPNVTDPDTAKWVYVGRKNRQEMLDSDLYINKERLRELSTRNKNIHSGSSAGSISLDQFNDFYGAIDDNDEHVEYDLYYLPVLKLGDQTYRNMIVGIANEQLLVRFHPNMFPRGMSPLVFCGWMHDTDNPYSIGPIEDLLDIQKTINILWNYKLEVLARAGNRFAVRPNVDLSNFFGVAGGIAVTDDPKNDISNFSGDYAEIASIDNSIGVLKAEGQLVAGAQNPFQGSASIDYQKTATELQILQENSISVLREVIEHISVMGIQRVLERLMYLVSELYGEPIEVPVHHPIRGREFQAIDFSMLKSGDFTIELVSTNPSQSKQAQINGLMQLLELMHNSPDALITGQPVIEKIGDLVGVKNIRDLLEQIRERTQLVKQQSDYN